MIRYVLAAFVVAVALSGCAGARIGPGVFYPPGVASAPLGVTATPPGVAPAPLSAGANVTMKYLGNGGWVIRRGDDVIVTAPFFSNPRGANVYLPGTADPAAIDKGLEGTPLTDVRIVLLGHSHYDHAMDLPYILNTKAKGATVYGSKTATHLLKYQIDRRQDGSETAVDVTPVTTQPAEWRPSAKAPMRFKPVLSNHAPHFAGFVKVVSWAKLDQDQASLPLTPAEWPEGETLAFLIDVMQGETPVFRIYYQDSAAPPGVGVPDLSDGVPVDVAILCVAGFAQVKDSPRSILHRMGKDAPRYVVGGHWEDFFSRFAEPNQVAFGTSLADFVRLAHAAVPNAPVIVPVRGETLTFPIRAR